MATELNLSKELAKLHLNHHARLDEIGALVQAISSPYGFGYANLNAIYRVSSVVPIA
jgi:hypothetical protein